MHHDSDRWDGLVAGTAVLEQRLADDELVFLNLDSGEYYGLDATGTAMWDALQTTDRVQEAVEILLGRFDVDEPTLRQDLLGLIGELAERGLIVPRTTP